MNLFSGALFVVIFAMMLATTQSVLAQATADTDVAQSMGVGLQSRFASGATPVQLARTSITPGTPMSVSSTMSNMMSGSNNSFGGILSRYDTSNFGKFFGTGNLAPRANSDRIAALENLLPDTDNEIENEETARMYPPRLVLNFREHPRRSLTTKESTLHLSKQVENVLARFKFDPKTEIVNVETQGQTVIITGKVKSGRMSRLLESVLGVQGGVENVVNQLEVAIPETLNVDVYGNEL